MLLVVSEGVHVGGQGCRSQGPSLHYGVCMGISLPNSGCGSLGAPRNSMDISKSRCWVSASVSSMLGDQSVILYGCGQEGLEFTRQKPKKVAC